MSSQFHEYFTYDSLKSCDYGVWISGENTFVAPERDVEIIEVPGRNGTLSIDNGRWKNIQFVYPCFMSGDFLTNFQTFKAKLLTKKGYLKLEDTYHSGYYRMARVRAGIVPKPGAYNKSAKFNVAFDCWPQLFLTSGDTVQTIVSSGSITGGPADVGATPALPEITIYLKNPTTYSAKTGSITVGTRTISFTSLPYLSGYSDEVTINCEEKEITQETITPGIPVSVASYFTGDFPNLTQQTVSVSYSGDIRKLEIKPRWWTI